MRRPSCRAPRSARSSTTSLDEKGEAYTLYTISGVPREAFAEFPMPRNTAVFGPTFARRGHRALRRHHARTRATARTRRTTACREGHLPVRSYLAVPVKSRSGEVLGGLFFGHPEAGMFTERAERIVAAIAVQAGIAIDKARLYRAAQDEIATTQAGRSAIARKRTDARSEGTLNARRL